MMNINKNKKDYVTPVISLYEIQLREVIATSIGGGGEGMNTIIPDGGSFELLNYGGNEIEW